MIGCKTINLGASGGGKWFDSTCLPKACMVVENRYVLRNAGLIGNFWDIFKFARDNRIKQIITLDMCLDISEKDHLRPTETELREVVRGIKKSLLDNRIPRELACFQLDNEPAKNGVPMGLYCWQANVIHDELAGAYDLYVGGEEVSYRTWYQNIVPNF